MPEKSILIINKDKTQAKKIHLAVAQMDGFRPVYAGSVPGALRHIRGHNFFMIITHVTIDKPLDGLQLIQFALRGSPQKDRPHVIATADEKAPPLIRRCARAGARGFLPLPLDPSLLKKCVNRICDSTYDWQTIPPKPRRDILKALQPVMDLPAIPAVREKVIDQTDQLDQPAILQWLRFDPVLTAKSLRLANAPYLGYSRHITSPKEAAQLFGDDLLHAACSHVHPLDETDLTDLSSHFDLQVFWKHSAACGVFSSRLANFLKLDADAAFNAGLLHDIGKIAMVVHLATDFDAILKMAQAQSLPFHEAETRRLAMTHQEIGLYLLEKWTLPEELVAAVGGHHTPSVEKLEETPLIGVVHLANAMCHQSAETPETPFHPPRREVLKTLELDDSILAEIQAEAQVELQQISRM